MTMTTTPITVHGGLRRPAVTWAAVAVTALAIALVSLAYYTHDSYWDPRWTVDFKVYLASGHAVLHDERLYDLAVQSPLYGPMPYLYPPLTAMLFFVPLQGLSVGTASLVWNTAALIALGGVIWLSLDIAGVRKPRTRSILTVLLLIGSAFMMPVRMQIIAGQINSFLVLLVLADFRRNAGRWRGVGVGIAAGLKITPLIFIGYFIITRQWREARNATFAFLGTVAVGFVFLPADAWRYWTGTVLESSRAGGVFDTPNQSLSGAMARIFTQGQFTHWWLGVLALVALAGLAVAWYAHRRGSDFLGFAATALTALLVSPISWEHHWVYVIPLLVWLAVRAWQHRSAALGAVTAVLIAIFTIRLFMVVGIPESPPAPLDLPVWKELIANMYPVTALVLLAVAPLWIRHTFTGNPAEVFDHAPAAATEPVPPPVHAVEPVA
jgi:alpha-1,2-mannosyltransferase